MKESWSEVQQVIAVELQEAEQLVGQLSFVAKGPNTTWMNQNIRFPLHKFNTCDDLDLSEVLFAEAGRGFPWCLELLPLTHLQLI